MSWGVSQSFHNIIEARTRLEQTNLVFLNAQLGHSVVREILGSPLDHVLGYPELPSDVIQLVPSAIYKAYPHIP